MDGADADALARGRVIEIGDVGLEVRVRLPAHAAAIAHLLGGMDQFEGAPSLELRWQAAPLAVPARPPEVALADLEIWHTEDGVVVHHGALTALAAERRLLVSGGGPAPDAPLWLDFRRVFEPAITYLLSEFDRFMVHGAAITRGGSALYVAGDTGQGKSTLAWAARQARWGLLADDYVVVRPAEGGGHEVSGLRKPVSVPSELFEGRPEGARRLERAGRQRWELPASILTPGWFRLDGVLFPAHGSGDEAELRAVSAVEALPGILGAFIASGDARALRRWFPHAASLSRLPLWELRHALPPHARLESAARRLDDVFGAEHPAYARMDRGRGVRWRRHGAQPTEE